MSLVSLTVKKADSSAATDAAWAFDTAVQGTVDANGSNWLDIAAGARLLTIRAGGVTTTLPVYVPTLEGPFTVSAIKTPRPTKAVVMYGAAGSFHGLEALTTLIGSSSSQKTEQTFATVAVPGWAFEPGKSAGWSEWADGKLWMAGQDQKLNVLNPASTECVVSMFDPGTQVLKHFVIPTTHDYRNVIGSNGFTGGAPGADVCAVQVGRETYIVGLSSAPYQGWSIGTFGQFPTLPVLRKVGGAWSIDEGKSRTTDDLHNLSANGATAFPWTTNSAGEQYGNTLGLSELDATPGGHLISAEYFQDPAVATRGGRMVAIDPATGIVLAYYTVPFTPDQNGVHTLAPRAVVCDPTGTSGNYRFGVIFDCFDSGGADVGSNVCQFFNFDETGPTITPLTNWLATDAAATHWGNWAWDDDGWLWIGRRNGTPVAPTAVFPKVDGSIALLAYPYAPYAGTFQQVATPSFTVTVPTAQASQPWGRLRYDAGLNTSFMVSGNHRITPIAKGGDAHAPVLTMLPIVNPEVNDYIVPAISGLLFPSDSSIDHVARALYVPIAQTFKNSDPYPQAPQVKDQWVMALDIDRVAAQPCFVGSTHTAQINKTSITPTLPTFWQGGDLIIAFMTNGLTSDPATSPVSLASSPQTWQKPVDVRNGGAGLRYVVAYRVMTTGDSGPTFSWTGNQNPTCMVVAYRGIDASTPIETIVQNIGAAGSSSWTTLLPRLSLTPSVTGCRIVGIYAIQGQQDATLGQGEITPGEIARADQVGNGLGGGISCIVTEEEQLATTNPTRQRAVLYTSAALEAAFTLAIRPAPTPANPPAVSSVACVPNPVAHGNTTVCTVTLASAAPTQGCVATVTASNNKATVPYTCFIAGGATTGTVNVNAITAGTVTISAKTAGSTQSTVLTIT